MRTFILTALILAILGAFISLPTSAVAVTNCINGVAEVAPGIKVPCRDDGGPASQGTVGGFVLFLIDIALFIIGAVTVLFLVIGGFRYVTAYGNEEQLESAKSIVRNSIVGLLIVILSFVMVRAITNFLISGFV